MEWSRERVEQLAPDAVSARAGLGLAKPAQWRTLGRTDHVIWGECQGSGTNPYQVRVASFAASAPVDPEAQLRRQEKRESRIALGLEQLQAWMSDIMTQGLAHVRTQPANFWAAMASRLVDAQAPGLANRVRDMGAAAMSEECWSERLLAAEVRTLIGWTQKQDELLALPGRRTAV